MKIQDVSQFIFHPWSNEHSLGKKIAATITDIALTILSAGLFLIPFIYFQNVKVVTPPTPASKVAQSVLKPEAQKTKPTSTLSPKAQQVKEKQAWQLKQFEQWAAKGQWDCIHRAHYDWWMYPINRSSAGQGSKYTVHSKEIAELKADPEFMRNYLRGVELGAKAWGWDIHAKKLVANPSKDQKWQNWNVRLGKMADSLSLFGQEDLRASMLAYALHAGLNLEDWIWKALGLSS